jgi:hypothetical protein
MGIPPDAEKGSLGRLVRVERKQFQASKHAAPLAKHKEYLDRVLRLFLESVYIYHDTAPKELDASEFRAVVLDTLPRCFAGDEKYLAAVPEIVEAYVEYLKDEGGVDDQAGFEKVLAEMRKKFTKTAKKVKPADRLGQDEASQITKDPKEVGRNDPCPCGSGKKYKKCCLAKS